MGPITIGCYPTLAPTVLPPLLHDFGEAHPRVQLHIFEATQDQMEGRIESGEVDVAFVYDTLVPGMPRREQLFALACARARRRIRPARGGRRGPARGRRGPRPDPPRCAAVQRPHAVAVRRARAGPPHPAPHQQL
ncbi:LysR substrate-binding domain-containing protein [Microbacterium elymi]|uniref:LysR substrate-binding domain-containing protein n=1 Tax=Microbacterium elymi TaxID=2909587 RepID=A0ABY5NMW1_9MICO|nr:LysR substrate-binding domain-containing protein [Microbacterium elymi]UUT36529.1 LysR substrate-binding domain-containing protein [Microbacterium elymi]